MGYGTLPAPSPRRPAGRRANAWGAAVGLCVIGVCALLSSRPSSSSSSSSSSRARLAEARARGDRASPAATAPPSPRPTGFFDRTARETAPPTIYPKPTASAAPIAAPTPEAAPPNASSLTPLPTLPTRAPAPRPTLAPSAPSFAPSLRPAPPSTPLPTQPRAAADDGDDDDGGDGDDGDGDDGAAAADDGGGGDAPVHVVYVLADDLGWNDVGYQSTDLGARNATGDAGAGATPNLDRLAASGVKLSHFYALPDCTPSRAALLTGKYPIHTGLFHEVRARERSRTSADRSARSSRGNVRALTRARALPPK